MKKLLLAAGLLTLAALSPAARYTQSLGAGPFALSDSPIRVDFTGVGDSSPIRAFGVTGDWVNGNGAWAAEFSYFLQSQSAAPPTSSSLFFTADAPNSGDPATIFEPLGLSTWEFDAEFFQDMGFYGPAANSSLSVYMAQLFAGTTASISNLAAWYLTDAIAPFSGTMAGGATFTRPSDLTSLASGSFTYRAHAFQVPVAGSFLIGADYRDASGVGTMDGYLALYEGGFDPLSPLTNLIGIDDDGLALGIDGSAMYMQLDPTKSYTAVVTTFGAASPPSNAAYNLYVAGVPEPMTMTLLALGAAAIAKRRRNKRA
ncbi:MAG: PEP-CTERM sorting domain-containing protein [Fimbriimonadaceae bacterium]|jgi:hypothetical protein|nr:PEP-CTERM sorting domain-containing protein [Fimbriimonadaceae bacterium]